MTDHFFNWPWDKKLSQYQIVYDAVHFSLISSFEVYKFHILPILKSVYVRAGRKLGWLRRKSTKTISLILEEVG